MKQMPAGDPVKGLLLVVESTVITADICALYIADITCYFLRVE